MQEEWLIDGTNLLHSGPKPKTPLELIHRIAGFASAHQGRGVLLVFDGKVPPGEWESLASKQFRIESSGSLTADSVIERYLCENKGRFQFTVVTADRAVVRMAHGSGARVMSPKEFVLILGETEKGNKDILFDQKVKGHGFNRPFRDKLDENKGL